MKKLDFAKLAFIVSCVATIFIFGLLVGAYRLFPYDILQYVKDSVSQVYEERRTLAGTKPEHFLEPARYDGNGVTVNKTSGDREELILLQGFFGDGLELRLIRRSGAVVARWPVRYSELAAGITHGRNAPATDWNVEGHGALALPDGSVVFSLDHIGLFKLDRCGTLVWLVDSPTHHSVERNADGSFWVSSADNFYRDMDSPYPLFKTPFAADALMRVSPEGEILDNIPLVDVFKNSDKLGLLTLTGGASAAPFRADRPDFDREIFHLNDVEELPADIAEDFPMFAAGDLLVSLRNRNLLVVIDRDTKRIKWWQIGPWVRQHDPDWKPGGTITVFDNNRDGTNTGGILGGSRIIEIDPATSKSRVAYGGSKAEFFYSIRRGKHQDLSGNRTLITEAEAGRVFEIDADKQTVWEYINRYSDTENARITEARAYPPDYFSVEDWSCPAK